MGAAAVAVGTGAVTGATNNVIAQTGNGVGLGGVEWGSVGASAVVGGVSGVAAYGGGQLASQFGGVVVNGLSINSPVLNGLVTGAIGGAGGGAAAGAAGAWLTGGDVGQGALAGLKMGAAIGGGIGAGVASCNAYRSGINPLTGKVRNNYA